ncbi:MAG TPA: nuclear transport factor 2 family protein [Blastocatellia bacterium]|nr:nuclear transport factor 2 family protein [Blastocatellia bacterium]
MSIEQNKEIAAQFFAHFNAGNVAGALEMMSEDATWWIPGKPDQLPVAGPHNKEQITGILSSLTGELKNGLKMTIKGSIAEGDRVAIETESYGELKNGRIYNNEYHFLLTIRDGKIREVKEYLDTQHVFAIWFQP